MHIFLASSSYIINSCAHSVSLKGSRFKVSRQMLGLVLQSRLQAHCVAIVCIAI